MGSTSVAALSRHCVVVGAARGSYVLAVSNVVIDELTWSGKN